MAGNVVLTSGREKPVQGDTVRRGSNCAHRLGNRCLEGSRDSNGRYGAPELSQHVYSWVGDLGISFT